MQVLSTYRILKAKVFNEDVDESWIDWALEMMEAGYQSDNLYALAGAVGPYNQFELQELAGRVLQDLDLDYSNRELVLNNYICLLLSASVDRPETYPETLLELSDVYYQSGMDGVLTEFYLLQNAKTDLEDGETQEYWKGANKENIDQVIRVHFQTWLKNFHHQSLQLRQTEIADLDTLFQIQLDKEACYLAAFTPKDHDNKPAYIAKFTKLLSNPAVNNKTIMVDGKIVGSIAKFEMNGEAEITYWIDRSYWGRGIGTNALKNFLSIETTRPIFGRVAFDNFSSQKLLEKSGFVRVGSDRGFANAREKEIEEFIYKLV